MKTIVIITDEEAYFSVLERLLKSKFTVLRYDAAFENTADLVLVVAEEQTSEFFNSQSILKSKFENTPTVFLWIQEEKFRVLQCENFSLLDGFTISKTNDELLKFISESALNAGNDGNVYQHLSDIQSDIHNMYRGKTSNGALEVEYNNFARIYQFVEQLIERSGKPMQTLLLTLEPRKGMNPSDENLSQAKEILADAIQLTLRKNDVMTHYSASQMLVLLVDADDAGGHFATNRIINTFFGMYDDDFYELNYDIRPVGKKRR